MTDDRDLVAVQESALLVEVLAGRGDLSAFADDPLAGLLGSWVAEVDHGSAGSTPDWGPAVAAAFDDPQPVGRRHPVAVLSAVAVAGLLVTSSGVAAAVTGDPFAHVKAGVTAVAEAAGRGPSPVAKEPLPVTAADVAQVNRQLTGVRALIAQGDLEAARARLADVQDLLAQYGDLPPGVQQRIDQLLAAIDRAEEKAERTPPGQGDKPDKPAKPEKPEKPAKPEKPEKPAKPEKPEKPAKPEQPATSTKAKPGQQESRTSAGDDDTADGDKPAKDKPAKATGSSDS